MSGNRKILHIDLDAFFCAVEELQDPNLRGTAFAVGGDPDHRGVISSCSYAARSLGIHSAMPTIQALRICPSLRLVHSGHGLYSEKSKKVMAILWNYSPLIEQVSIDEAFLDVSDLPDPSAAIAKQIQGEIREKTKLPCSLGCSTNKLVAKIANTVGKKKVKTMTYPSAVTTVTPGKEADFLAPLPIGKLWGIGKKTEARLIDAGIHTIGQLAVWPEPNMIRFFGKNAHEIHEHANGRDASPVNPDPGTPKSISQETTFSQDVLDEELLRQTILLQAEQVGFRLRKHGLKGTVVKIKLRWPDFTTITRQTQVEPVDRDSAIAEAAQTLFTAAWFPDRKPVRLLGVGVAGISEGSEQLSLFSDQGNKEDKLLQAIDSLRTRYGKEIIMRGVNLESVSHQDE